ncbi:MAG: SDR family NAD(P)-dependent oxidoreductase, partial [Verrucomicrobiae bacterium]|nr:SDR family NAD(P)-dependent oxidoreductase [Verrucomicrobiae bacterium]
MPENPQPPPADPLRVALETLEAVVDDRALLDSLSPEEHQRFIAAAGDVFCPDVNQRRRLVKARQRKRKADRIRRDEESLNETGIRALRRKPVFTTPNVFAPPEFEPEDRAPGSEEANARRVDDARNCYICKRDYAEIHHFYDQLCPPCAELNFRKRTETADLRGRVALLTGGRVKIGYQAGIKLLRAGARVIVTTRFPRDSATRYAAEPDFAEWGHRLEIFGLDLRHTPSVEAFCAHLLATRDRLDFIVNNACQTVRRPPDFYRHMMGRETAELAELPDELRQLLGAWEGLRGYRMLPEGKEPSTDAAALGVRQAAELAGLARAAELSQAPLLPEEIEARDHLFPEGRLDQDLQQVDLRERNSWRFLMAEVPTVELLETQLVNAVAPFVLNARLKPLLLRVPTRDKHIVNVSAVEGQFYRRFKTTRHPHT